MSILQEMVAEVMTELEAEANDEDDDISGGSSEDDTMQFVTAHTNLAALSPNIASSESDTGTMVEHGDNTMVDDMGMGTLVITEDGEDDGTMKREEGRGLNCGEGVLECEVTGHEVRSGGGHRKERVRVSQKSTCSQ